MANNQSRPPRRGPMGPGMGPGVGEKAKDFKSAVKRLVKELGKFKILIIIALILAIAGAVLSISAPDRLSKLTDEIQAGIIPKMENGQIIMPEINMDAIKSIAISLVILYLFSAICTFIQSICMTEVANNFARSLRTRISVKINKLPLSYFDRHQSGDTLSRVTNDVDTIAQTMNQSLGTLVSNITLFLGSIIMMFYTNWIMALTAILSSLLGFMGMFAVLAKSQKYFVAKQEELGNLNGHIEEVYSGLNVVKAYNGKKESDKKFDEYNQKVCEANRKSQFLSGIMQPIMNFIGNFGYVAVCIVGALLTMNNIISFGVIIAFITYVRLFTNPLSQIAQSMTSLQSTAAASERVFEFLDEKEMADTICCYFDGKYEFNISNKIKNYSYENVKFIWKNFIDEILYKKDKKKCLFVSSQGGHLNELLKLKDTINNYNSLLVTEKCNNNLEYKTKYLMATTRYQLSYVYGIFYNFFKSLNIFLDFNPDVIISTGSHTAIPLCFIGYLFSKKIIYIESYANISTKSLAGRIVYNFADVFIVQWEDMLKLYPNAIYIGGLY